MINDNHSLCYPRQNTLQTVINYEDGNEFGTVPTLTALIPVVCYTFGASKRHCNYFNLQHRQGDTIVRQLYNRSLAITQ